MNQPVTGVCPGCKKVCDLDASYPPRLVMHLDFNDVICEGTGCLPNSDNQPVTADRSKMERAFAY